VEASGEAFWRAHHEAWKRSDLNQREYCEAHGLPQKGFENWRAKFKAEPQSPARKLLYRRHPRRRRPLIEAGYFDFTIAGYHRELISWPIRKARNYANIAA
jgi:hypothetical protein